MKKILIKIYIGNLPFDMPKIKPPKIIIKDFNIIRVGKTIWNKDYVDIIESLYTKGGGKTCHSSRC